MGKKAVNAMAACCFFAFCAYTAAFFLPQHRLDFFMAKVIRVATMKTHVLNVEFPVGNGDFCLQVFKMAGKLFNNDKEAEEERRSSAHFCDNLEGTHEIQDVTSVLCSPLVGKMWGNFCGGLEKAHFYGTALLICAGINALLCIIGVYLLHDYANRKANPTTRSMGTGLVFSGTALMAAAVAVYGVMVVHNLDSVGGIGSNKLTNFILSTGTNKGFGPGFVIFCAGVVLQMSTAFFLPWVENADGEEDYFYAKEEKEEARDAKRNGYGATDNGMQGGMQMQGGAMPMGAMAVGGGGAMVGGGMMMAGGPTVVAQSVTVEAYPVGPGY